MADERETYKQLDARSLRGLAHPLRVRILGLLRTEGPATSARLAKRLTEDSGNISWHLRRLANTGFITEETDFGTRRERWWRAVHDHTRFDIDDVLDGDPRSGTHPGARGHRARLPAGDHLLGTGLAA
ncbi:winged helix-turn-helix domain-containing protein [Amycolatopsis cihanbeyliensis]|uniref:winged helix-turn-helix domain-containing protein n=1 Tax=Amycolatopsis cihanbeyliensis TaxID=1128664 RepID=UPI00114F19AB|nr:helix-turn-helix domain-containing protein [Amycolatopsis cihanbeyliensis]